MNLKTFQKKTNRRLNYFIKILILETLLRKILKCLISGNISKLGGLKKFCYFEQINDIIDDENKLKINENIKLFLNKLAISETNLQLFKLLNGTRTCT